MIVTRPSLPRAHGGKIMASESDVHSNCIINCVAIFYEEGKGGENFRKKNKFRCKIQANEKRVVKLRETER